MAEPATNFTSSQVQNCSIIIALHVSVDQGGFPVVSERAQNGIVMPTRGIAATIQPKVRFAVVSPATGGASAARASGNRWVAIITSARQTAQFDTQRA